MDSPRESVIKVEGFAGNNLVRSPSEGESPSLAGGKELSITPCCPQC